MDDAEPFLLEVEDLVVEFRGAHGSVLANNHVSLRVRAGETLGIVGESGSGKSVFCRALLRLLPSPPAHVRADRIVFAGRDLQALTETKMRQVRGLEIAMIFQNPMSSLNPVWPIGDQVSEGLRVHRGVSQRDGRRRAVALLRRVGIPSPEIRVDDYPHQWSGGMLQRAAIAMAIAGEPKIMLADEPTTALDVTIQDQILSLLLELQRESGMALVLVSHDMGVIAETCDRVAVMYAGRILELAPTKAIFTAPAHPYSHGLLRSIPRVEEGSDRLSPIPGQPPDLSRPLSGCPFADRCTVASAECRQVPVQLRTVSPGHSTACLFPERVALLDKVAAQ